MPSAEAGRYFTSTAVFLNEVVKLLVSLIFVYREEREHLNGAHPNISLLVKNILKGDAWKLAIPAALYTVI